MNKDNAAQFLPLVQALADGKTIQVKGVENWRDLVNPTFDMSPSSYRIRPEPREWTIWAAESGLITEMNMAEHSNWKQIRVREILD